jgi:hypothetical protein
MAKRTFAEIASEREQLMGAIQEILDDPMFDDTDAAAVAQMFDAVNAELTHKVDAIAAVINELTGRAEAKTIEARRLRDAATACSNKASRLKNYARSVMDALGTESVKGEAYELKIVRNGGIGSLSLDDDVTPEWLEANGYEQFVSTVKEVANPAIRAAIQSGEDIPFARILPPGTRLDVR